MKPADDELDALLARGRLGGPLRDRIAERVLDRAAGARRSCRRHAGWVAALTTPVVVGAMVALMVLRNPPPDEEFLAKGAPSGLAVDLVCTGGSLDRCPVGRTLLFEVRAATAGVFLAAYADPSAGGERAWYFSAEGESPAVSVAGSQILRRGIRLGPEHAPGRYVVHLFLSTRPLGRKALRAGRDPGILFHTTVPLTVVQP